MPIPAHALIAPAPTTSATIALSHVGAFVDSTPGAASQATGNFTFVAGTHLVAVQTSRASSTDPVVPTLTGWSTTWTQVATTVTTGTFRIRWTLFRGVVGSGGTAALTVAYSVAAVEVGVVVVKADNVASVVQAVTGSGTATVNTLIEVATLAAASDAANRFAAFCHWSSPTAGTGRGELDADTNGDADWTSFTLGTDAGGDVLGSWFNGTPVDVTPGFIRTAGSASSLYVMGVELAP